jgi:sortase B
MVFSMKKIKNLLTKINSCIDKSLSNNMIRKVLLLVCGIVFIYSSFMLIRWAYDNYRTNQSKNALAKIADVNAKEEDLFEPSSSSGEETFAPIDINKIKFLTTNITELKKLNPQTVAWLRVLSSDNLNYPVVQADDNDFYLKRDFNKAENEAGWIFGDFRDNFDNLGRNTIIYGHARGDYSMFGSLAYCLESWWYKQPKNHFIWLNTEKENMVFQIFSIYVTDLNFYYIQTDFRDNDEFASFLTEIKSKNQAPPVNYDVLPTDKILTLSTCRGNNKRIVIHAKLVKTQRLVPDVVSSSVSSLISSSVSAKNSSASSSSASSSKTTRSSSTSHSSSSASAESSSPNNTSSTILESSSSNVASTASSSSGDNSSEVISSEPASSDPTSSEPVSSE